MRTASALGTTKRLPWRSVTLGLLVVVSAMAGLAMLAEAMSSDGGTVYLANIQPGSPGFAAKPSIVVTGVGRATAPAAWATLQVVVGANEGSYVSPNGVEGTVTPGERQRALIQPVVDAIIAQDVAPGAVQIVTSQAFSSYYCYGPGCDPPIRIDISVEEPTLDRIDDVLEAVGVAVGGLGLRIQQVAVGYSVPDCAPLLAQARERAIADAKTRAVAQAAALDVTLGDLILSSEPASTLPTDDRGCPRPVRDEFSDLISPTSAMVTLPIFDPTAPPETSVEIQVSLAFAIDPADGSADTP